MRRLRLAAALRILIVCTIAIPAFAQRGHGGVRGGDRSATKQREAPLETFEQMSLEDREAALAKLPQDRREKLRQQLRSYDQLTPAQKKQLRWFAQLPPDRQEAFRKLYKKFANEPAERQLALRDEMSHLSTLTPDDRKAHLASPEIVSRFNKNERQMLTQMSEALPFD